MSSSRYSPAEWQARVDLAACYRLMPLFGMSDLVYNHITARIPGTDDEILINPYGWLYEEITASSLIKINIHGEVLDQGCTDLPVNLAGYVIHSAVHRHRHDVGCVIHTHTRCGMAVSCMKEGLLPITQTAMRFADVSYHDYESVAIDMDEQQRLVHDLGQSNSMILRNHGLLVACPSTAEAFNAMYWLEMACRAQVDVMTSGADIIRPSQAIVEKTFNLYQPHVRRPFGILEWPAMLRYLDRRDPSYKT